MAEECFPQLCECLSLAPLCEERNQGYRGLVCILSARPALLLDPAAAGHHVPFLRSCGSWTDPPEDPSVLSALSSMVQAVQRLRASDWRAMLSEIDPEARDSLRLIFHAH